MEQNQQMDLSLAMQASWVSVGVNLVLSLGKLAAGLIGQSAAMVSDGVHSASDVFSTVIVMAGLRLSQKGPDTEHEYGHERLESAAALVLSAVLGFTGLMMGAGGVRQLLSGTVPPVPGRIALWAAVISIAVKEAMFWYTRWAANKCNSVALMASAWHHRSDALSSVGSLAGIGGARLGWPILDSVASVVICLFILKAAIDIFRTAMAQMTDRAASPQLEQEMRTLVEQQPGVERLDELKTRQFGSRIYVDVEIAADGDLSLRESHEIAQQVHDSIEQTWPNVKHCMVHVNPLEE